VKRFLPLILFLLAACASAPPQPVHVVIAATTDVHGTIDRLPVFATEIRALRAANPGHVILVDSGDVYQGTLESNFFEGEPLTKTFDAIGYDAVAVGNHEFDYGLAALKKNAANATWPFLAANLVERSSGATPSWAHKSKLVTIDGAKIGIIGLSTPDTPNTTTPENIVTLRFDDPVAATTAEAAELRKRGADAIVVIAHMGGGCKDMNDVNDVASCDPAQEAMSYLRALPPHAVDAYFGGHTHQQMRQIVAGVPAVQAKPYGREFSEVDLWIDRVQHRVVRSEIRPMAEVAGAARDEQVAAILKPYADRVAAKKNEPLGIRLGDRFTRQYHAESPLGDLLADLAREWGNADAAFVNSGGIRIDLQPGELTYGTFFELYPFDNFPSIAEMTGQQIIDALRLTSVGNERGILQVSGIRYVLDLARPREDRVVSVTLANGQPLDPNATYKVAMSDFLVKGGDGLKPVMSAIPPQRIHVDQSISLRDATIAALKHHAGAPLMPKTDGRITQLNAPAPAAPESP
jgi:5'-nucleotidase